MISAMAQCRMQIEKCKIAFCQIGTFARLHVRTLARWNWEMGTGNFCFPFSIFLTVFCRLEPNSTTTAKGGGK